MRVPPAFIKDIAAAKGPEPKRLRLRIR